jgi:8-oxo-dGTP pyrophosphatase MutT (NUDIX family)
LANTRDAAGRNPAATELSGDRPPRPQPPLHGMTTWPLYACAILEDAAGRLLLEQRPDDAALAAGMLTCFGGRREAGESPEECLRRELREELGWEPRSFQQKVVLRVGGELVAWFYHAALDVGVNSLCVPAGYKAVLIAPQSLGGHPLSPWHAAVLSAWREGRTNVDLDR